MKGKLIVIEGIDGSGKSTCAKNLAEKLNSINIKTIYTFEPTHSHYGAKLRDGMLSEDLDAEEELLLFVKDRKEHIEYMIKPALEEGYFIILDRYFYSSIAYQGAKGIDINRIINLHKDFIIKPDIVFIFHLPIDIALNRIISKRGIADRFENETYLKKVDKIFRSFNEPFIYHIDTDKDIKIINDELFNILEKSKMLVPYSLQ
ncbi:dTMP kinase [Brachyspira aalborgi]|uniref:Thymidylate kinase n=1 Tax=Brachyspira aalborgi TaxID=29522 RepID=A0AB38PXF7_9SPIR|nr:dTMP kinase [Brachyspira aalborgi]TXJ15746.1 dTMP kinase [Brachyspira aalborgi]TXJ19019.1 dTMP kinase [Brachyspira aalborgi]TXJ25142.1 dTMP kinase [Brachyspira aalborgi]TXJ47152.1 dTMP kinase [Brachyspira aalborgi]